MILSKRATFLNSLEDDINSLQSMPITTILKRISTAHLSIEKSIKFLIMKAKDVENIPKDLKTHDLSLIFEELKTCDSASACFLEDAFEDAVHFFRCQTDLPEQNHFSSLSKHLETVGNQDEFIKRRYLDLEKQEISEVENRISLTMHLEILHALKQLISLKRENREFVKKRVERLISEELKESRQEKCSPFSSGYSVTEKTFYGWISHNSPSKIMSDTIKRDFKIETPYSCMNEIVKNKILKDAHDKLTKSGDRAILYFLETVKILPPQQKGTLLLSCLQTHDGIVKTPVGVPLGRISQRYDGFWSIECFINYIQLEYKLAHDKMDAIQYLITSVTTPVSAKIDGHEVEIHLVGRICMLPKQMIGPQNNNEPWKYEFQLWNNSHNIEPGQHISLSINSKDNTQLCSFSDVYEGEVTGVEVESGKITLLGHGN